MIKALTGLAIAGLLLAGCATAQPKPALTVAPPGCAPTVCLTGTFTIEAVMNGDNTYPVAKLSGAIAESAKYYPLRALQASKSGEASIRCEKASHCSLLNQTIGDFGFGDAALEDIKLVPEYARNYPFEAHFIFYAPGASADAPAK